MFTHYRICYYVCMEVWTFVFVNLDTILCFFVHECSVYEKCILLVYSMHVITPAYWYWKGIPVLMPTTVCPTAYLPA